MVCLNVCRCNAAHRYFHGDEKYIPAEDVAGG